MQESQNFLVEIYKVIGRKFGMNKSKITAIFMSAAIVFSLAACNRSKPTVTTSSSDTSAPSDVVSNQSSSADISSLISSSSSSLNSSSSVISSKKSTVSKTSSKATISTPASVIDNKNAMTYGLNFGGKTFTYATRQDGGPGLTREVNAFNQKYNAKLKLVALGYNTYQTQVAAAIAAGTPYNICWLMMGQTPPTQWASLFEPLQNLYTSADLSDPKNPSGGGIIPSLSSPFEWKGNLYAVADAGVTQVGIMLYNKKMFAAAGLPDPLTLYNAGQWTWAKYEQMGDSVTDSGNGIYFGGYDCLYSWFGANDAHMVTIVNGKLTADYSNTALINSLAFIEKISTGNNMILDPDSTGTDTTEFAAGNTYMFQTDTGGWVRTAPILAKSAAFGKDINNVGIVPNPIGPDNSAKAAVLTGAIGWAEGKGNSDKRVGIAWAMFDGAWKDPVKDLYVLPAQSLALCNTLKAGNVSFEYMGLNTSSYKVDNDFWDSIASATNGGGAFRKYLTDHAVPAQNALNDLQS
jgi:hypothetical protein